jgi:hypothetical protein
MNTIHIPRVSPGNHNYCAAALDAADLWGDVREGGFRAASVRSKQIAGETKDTLHHVYFEEAIWLAGSTSDALAQAIAALCAAEHYLSSNEMPECHYHLIHGNEALVASMNSAATFFMRCAQANQQIRPEVDLWVKAKESRPPLTAGQASPERSYDRLTISDAKELAAKLLAANPASTPLATAASQIRKMRRSGTLSKVSQYRATAFHDQRTNPLLDHGGSSWTLSDDGTYETLTPVVPKRTDALKELGDECEVLRAGLITLGGHLQESLPPCLELLGWADSVEVTTRTFLYRQPPGAKPFGPEGPPSWRRRTR